MDIDSEFESVVPVNEESKSENAKEQSDSEIERLFRTFFIEYEMECC